MSKLVLVILDSDIRYLDNLASYVTGHYRHRFNLLTFTSAEVLVNHVRQNDTKSDILLVSAAEYGDWAEKLDSGLIILLSGTATHPSNAPSSGHRDGVAPAASSVNIDSFERVDRYSGAEKLIADILKIYANSDRQPMYSDTVFGGRENKIITLVSAEGGCGRTSIAIALCVHFAKLKLKTLYIGLDSMGAENFAFDSDRSGGLSEIIYTMKTRPDRLGLKLEALEKCEANFGFFYFAPPLYPMDIDELQPADIDTLIARLRGAGIYDRVVIDTHNGLSLRNKALMGLADKILIVARGGRGGPWKLRLFKTQIDGAFGGQADDIYNRCQLFFNNVKEKFDAGSSIDDISKLFSAKATVLPYCPELRDEYSPGLLANVSHGFGAALVEAARKI